MKKLFAIAFAGVLMTSCVSNKKFAEMEGMYETTEDALKTAEMKLSVCEDEKKNMMTSYQSQIKTLESTNSALLSTSGDFATISKKGAENLERSLESMKEKDVKIKTM